MDHKLGKKLLNRKKNHTFDIQTDDERISGNNGDLIRVLSFSNTVSVLQYRPIEHVQ